MTFEIGNLSNVVSSMAKVDVLFTFNDTRFSQSENTKLPTKSKLPKISTDSNAKQSQKAQLPMLLTFSGMVIARNVLISKNALSPMDVTL